MGMLGHRAAVVLCIGLGVVLAGCQTPGRATAKESSVTCPACNAVTHTAAIKGLTYTRCACPSCKTVTTLNPALAETLRTYMGDDSRETAHVCDRCKAMVEVCPVCRKLGAK